VFLPLLLPPQAKRSRGAPKVSKPGDKVTVSIVVTDVKDFSDLTRRYPIEMNKAMGIHNNILRKASHNHAGYIMDQEVRAGAVLYCCCVVTHVDSLRASWPAGA
jgi:hypothetical protein